MSTTNANATKFPECVDNWLSDDGPAAIVLRETLRAVDALDGEPSDIFPPTFAAEADGDKKKKGAQCDIVVKADGSAKISTEGSVERKSGYNISETRSGKLCLIDSVGSQANRIEPLFKDGEYAALVPQITVNIKDGEKPINLLDAGHRAGDAIVRCTDLARDLEEAFIEFRKTGNATKLAKKAPTSLVFGVWDSRGTQVKLPRLLASTIEATDVEPLVRSAQYIPATDFGNKKEGLLEGVEGADDKDLRSKAGFGHAPATGTPGGVRVHGEIRRKATLSLIGVRDLRAPSDAEQAKLQRYILGLGLVALTSDQGKTLSLRQGCLLTRQAGAATPLRVVAADGTTDSLDLPHLQALAFAKAAAQAFVVGESCETPFRKQRAKEELAKARKE